LVSGAADLEEDLALALELNLLVVQLSRQDHRPVDAEQRVAIESVERDAGAGTGLARGGTVDDRRLHPAKSIASGRGPRGRTGARFGGKRWPIYARRAMNTRTVRLHRWDEIALEKVTEMVSRKIVTGEREMLAQVYLKRGCLVPIHSHESEQMTY